MWISTEGLCDQAEESRDRQGFFRRYRHRLCPTRTRSQSSFQGHLCLATRRHLRYDFDSVLYSEGVRSQEPCRSDWEVRKVNPLSHEEAIHHRPLLPLRPDHATLADHILGAGHLVRRQDADSPGQHRPLSARLLLHRWWGHRRARALLKVCYVDVIKVYGKGNDNYPDPRCPHSIDTELRL